MTRTLLLTGSFTGHTTDGINLVEFDDATGSLALVRPLPGARDASFLALDAKNRRLYATDEAHGEVGAFRLADGLTAIEPLGYEPSEATLPCYVSLSPDRTRLAVANYGRDVGAVFDLDAGGALKPGPQVLRGTGTTAEGHAHWVRWSPEGDRLYLVDLGHDEVRMHSWDAATGRAGPAQTAFMTPEKHGPRHLAFHPNGRQAYLLTEHGNTLVALNREADGTLTEINSVSSIPADFSGKAQAAHIQLSPDGSLIYVSNRGPHTIGVFRVASDGAVGPVQQVATGGEWPRFFLLLGRHLLVCNQNSDSIVVFDVDADGRLTPNGQSLAIKAPVMLLPVEA